MKHTTHIFTGEDPGHGEFTKGNKYHRVADYHRDGVSKGFYIDDEGEFRMVADSFFTLTPRQELDTPKITHMSRPERSVLAERWGVNQMTINNWQRAGDYFQPWRLTDALAGVQINSEPVRNVLKPGQLTELIQAEGFYLSELSVRWGWHPGAETLHTITTDPARVALFWDLLEGFKAR